MVQVRPGRSIHANGDVGLTEVNSSGPGDIANSATTIKFAQFIDEYDNRDAFRWAEYPKNTFMGSTTQCTLKTKCAIHIAMC